MSSKKSLLLPNNAAELASDATTALTVNNINSTNDEVLPLTPLSAAIDPEDEDDDTEDLQSILHSYIRKDRSPNITSSVEVARSKIDLAPSDDVSNDEFLERYVIPSRLEKSIGFKYKFKQFFILSNAGKPIYSLNGNDSEIVGFMGLITTVLSSIAETLDQKLQYVSYGELQIAIYTQEPLILVAVSKLNHESKNHIAALLEYIYCYLLSILSKPTITRSFQNRMNYDLRKVLTALDFHNLDGICMQVTYGQQSPAESLTNCELFTSHLLNYALPSLRITNTVRKKLNNILQSSRKIKEPESKPLLSLQKSEDVINSLLFALLVVPPNKIVSLARPKNHELSHRDLSILTYIVSSVTSDVESSSEDFWIPVCMPDFNSNGFLYAFIMRFDLASYVVVDGKLVPPQPVQIVLLSSNKNTFETMQAIAGNILDSITLSESLRCGLSDDLSIATQFPSGVDYFVFKLNKHNQFISSDTRAWSSSDSFTASVQITKYLSALQNLKSEAIGDADSLDKKLTYYKWNYDGWSVTGLRLSDKSYEFYCLCNHLIVSQDLIKVSLSIIKWCRQNIRRLTMEEIIY